MAEEIKKLADHGSLNIIGGCCGTTPEHISAIKDKLFKSSPRIVPTIDFDTSYTGIEPLIFRDNINFVNIGERTNVTGSSIFKKLIKNGDFEKALDVAKNK